MASPSPDAVAKIRSEVTDWTPSDAAIAAGLNRPSIANPTPQPVVPTPFTTSQVFGAVAPSSLAKLNSIAFLPDIRDKIAANDRPACGLYAGLLMAGGVITQPDYGAIMALFNATGPDPSWPAQISWAVANLGRPVDAYDIAASRPGA